MYNANSRQVLGPTTVPKLETGPEACQRTSWLPTRMHLPLCKLFLSTLLATWRDVQKRVFFWEWITKTLGNDFSFEHINFWKSVKCGGCAGWYNFLKTRQKYGNTKNKFNFCKTCPIYFIFKHIQLKNRV